MQGHVSMSRGVAAYYWRNVDLFAIALVSFASSHNHCLLYTFLGPTQAGRVIRKYRRLMKIMRAAIQTILTTTWRCPGHHQGTLILACYRSKMPTRYGSVSHLHYCIIRGQSYWTAPNAKEAFLVGSEEHSAINSTADRISLLVIPR
jgi:hypothetical protein